MTEYVDTGAATRSRSFERRLPASQRAIQVRQDLLQLELPRKLLLRNHNQIARAQPAITLAEPLSYEPLDEIATNSLAYLAGDRDAEPRRAVISPPMDENTKVARLEATSTAGSPEEVRTAKNLAWLPFRPGHAGMTLLPLDPWRQPTPALGAPPGQNTSTGGRTHASPKPMGSGSTDSAWLECTLHGGRLWCCPLRTGATGKHRPASVSMRPWEPAQGHTDD